MYIYIYMYTYIERERCIYIYIYIYITCIYRMIMTINTYTHVNIYIYIYICGFRPPPSSSGLPPYCLFISSATHRISDAASPRPWTTCLATGHRRVITRQPRSRPPAPAPAPAPEVAWGLSLLYTSRFVRVILAQGPC